MFSASHLHQVSYLLLLGTLWAVDGGLHQTHSSRSGYYSSDAQTDHITPEARDSCAMYFTAKSKLYIAGTAEPGLKIMTLIQHSNTRHKSSLLLTSFDFTGENTIHVIVMSMPTLRIIINIPKTIKIYTSKKAVLLYVRSSQPPVIVSQMSFIIPLENFICGKHCLFTKTLALLVQIPFNFEYINDEQISTLEKMQQCSKLLVNHFHIQC